MSVYFAQAGDYIKIGYSADPLSRITTVTRSGTRPADLPFGTETTPIGWVPGDRYREMALQVRFADQRVAGEWFRLDIEEVRELIWSDPCGIDVQRMSALAVFASLYRPEASRDELAAEGFHIEGVPVAEAVASLGRRMNAALEARGVAL